MPDLILPAQPWLQESGPLVRARLLRERKKFCASVGRLAVRSLYAELTLYPKPGLVSLVDNGSHDDMTAETFLRSLFSLRHYFIRITATGIDAAPFSVLKQLGIEAEQRMLAATRGTNTHRGAIFCLGLLCAAIGRCYAESFPLSPAQIRLALLQQWGDALAAHTLPEDSDSHGMQVAARYTASGAREEAALGLPSVFEVALPILSRTLGSGRGWACARVDALFGLMAHISDTNVYYRGGSAGARTVRHEARRFLASGGTASADWKARAVECHRLFVRHRLSPGGAADLLAATCLVHAVSHDNAFSAQNLRIL
jgi:triphosphoribosyl-dephospho-CoA synthase